MMNGRRGGFSTPLLRNIVVAGCVLGLSSAVAACDDYEIQPRYEFLTLGGEHLPRDRYWLGPACGEESAGSNLMHAGSLEFGSGRFTERFLVEIMDCDGESTPLTENRTGYFTVNRDRLILEYDQEAGTAEYAIDEGGRMLTLVRSDVCVGDKVCVDIFVEYVYEALP